MIDGKISAFNEEYALLTSGPCSCLQRVAFDYAMVDRTYWAGSLKIHAFQHVTFDNTVTERMYRKRSLREVRTDHHLQYAAELIARKMRGTCTSATTFHENI